MKVKTLIPLIKKSIIFILGFIFICFLLEMAFNFSIRQIDVGEYGVLNKINDGDINADILICGSSRALKAINSTAITEYTGFSCYNIASDGADIGIQLPKLKWYFEKNKKAKILIQDVSQFFGGISNSIYEPFKYIPYLSNDSLYDGLLRIDETFWYHKYFPPANLIYYNFDFYYKLLSELRNTLSNKDIFENGFLPDNSLWSSDFELYKKQNPNGIESSISDKYKSYILQLKNYCEQNGVVVVFTILPNYYRLAEISKNTKEITSFYNSLPNNDQVFFLDFGNCDISKNQENFYNFTHLNLTGANKFTQLLVDKLYLNKILKK